MSHSKSISPAFLQGIFYIQAHVAAYSDPLEALLCDEYVDICKDFDTSQLQESWSWRNVHVGRELARQLIDEKGAIKRRTLFQAIQLLEENLYSLGPGRHHDGSRQKHLLKILKLLYDNPSYAQGLKRINRPIGHRGAEKLIKETLLLPEATQISDAHARQAAIAALLTVLRQNVGSCFATAPAILIQQDLPLAFLADIAELLGTGRLTRIKEGVEYTVPLSPSWGMGDLLKPCSWSSLGNKPLEALALSPGLHAAFEAAGLMDQKPSGQEIHQQCFAIISKTDFLKEIPEKAFAVFSSDRLIQEVLLQAFGVSKQDVTDFSLRRVQGPLAELVIQSAQGSKTLACSKYIKAYEAAKGAFKGLTDNALLKAWEFTLASLSESKADFAKWNLYVSLGVDPEDPHGIGQSLYSAIQDKIHQINEEMTLYQSRYDHLFAQAKYLEGRMRNASESELGWIQAEYQIRKHELNRAIVERDIAYDQGKRLQSIYPKLIAFYGEKIKDYFQEVYDAEMHDVVASFYDDSPAGFRLMYKYGRSQTALWTMIHTPTEYIQHLTSFFVSTEIDLNQLPECEGLQKDITDLVTIAINTIKRPEFLESSLVRLARAYHEPLVSHPMEHLEQVKRKPWSYISGGTMNTLVKYYWRALNEPREAKRWVESENEYLAFLIDTLKELPLNVQRLYQENCDRGMLSSSPTHAFICKPGWPLIRKAWESDLYTYTWIKEQWIAPQHNFLKDCLLDGRMMDAVIQQLLLFIPIGYRPVVQHALKNFPFAMTPSEFRSHVIQALSYEKWLREGNRLAQISEELDSILYRFLPLFPEHQLRERLGTLFEAIDEIDDRLREQVLHLIETAEERVGKYRILSAQDLKEIAQGLLILALKETRASVFYYHKIVEAMQHTGLCYPAPFLFADTNWVNNVFGFTLNPGTALLELWRFDACGAQEGRPMTVWKRYLNGVDRQDWGLYIQPHQYGA